MNECKLTKTLQCVVKRAVERTVLDSQHGQVWFNDNLEPTVMAATSTFVPIQTSTTIGCTKTDQFTVNGTEITYTGSLKRDVRVVLSVSWETESRPNKICELGVTKNGAVLQRSIQRAELRNNRVFPRNATSSFIVSLEKNDKLQPVVANVTDGENIIILNLNFHVM